MKLDTKHRQAALRVAEGDWPDKRIAAEAHVNRMRIWKWNNDPDFAALVEQIKADLYAGILKRGIADKRKRIAAAVERHQRYEQVLELRAERYHEDLAANTGLTPKGLPEPAGKKTIPAEAATGMIVHQIKYSPSGLPYDEWVVDTGTSAEMRNLEKQVAQELGEWTDKSEVKHDATESFFDALRSFAQPGPDR